jgi:FkbM family methyltransferase
VKIVNGVWLPEGDTHFTEMLDDAPYYNGKASYQLKKIEAALRRLKRFRFALDIGAHVGLWSWVLADKFEKVAAFEPIGAYADCFARNLETATNVSLFRMALGDKSATAYMEVIKKNSGQSRMALKKEGAKVNMAMLDTFSFRDVDFIKIDVEGFETFVIKGGEKTIRESKPVMVVEQKMDNAERFGLGRWDAVKLLRDWGAREVEVIAGDHILVWDR